MASKNKQLPNIGGRGAWVTPFSKLSPRVQRRAQAAASAASKGVISARAGGKKK